jgi:GTP1/Obg family GTP-binding protein
MTFNAALVAEMKSLSSMALNADISVDDLINARRAVLDNLPGTYDELVDIAYDHDSPDVAIEAIELIAFRRASACKRVLRDISMAHQDPKVRSIARNLLLQVTTLELAKDVQQAKESVRH